MWYCEMGCKLKGVDDIFDDAYASDLGIIRKAQAHSATLAGGYHATLCDKCSDLWHKFITPNKKYLHLIEITREINVLKALSYGLGTKGDQALEAKSKLMDLDKRHFDLEEEIYAIASEWVKERKIVAKQEVTAMVEGMKAEKKERRVRKAKQEAEAKQAVTDAEEAGR